MESGENTTQITTGVLTEPELIEALKARLGNSLVYGITIPKYLKRKIKALKKLQLEHINLEVEFFQEVHNLEIKYENLYSPLYDKRRLITVGALEPTDEDCDFPSDSEKENDLEEDIQKVKLEDEGDKIEDEEGNDVKGIPDFWLTALKSASMVAEIIEEHDEPILKHLIDVKAVTETNPMGFYLEFHFEANKFFTNTVLVKHYEMKCVPEAGDPFSFDGPEIVKCKGCTIDWNKGMNVTVKTIKKKQKHKSRGAVRTVTKTVQNESFFNFFSPPAAPDDEEQMDEDTRTILSSDFEMGNFIKDRIVPQAVLYFTGENLVDDEFDEEEDDEEEEEIDEEDEESEDDEENETQRSRRKVRAAPPATQANQQQAPPECKQQ